MKPISILSLIIFGCLGLALPAVYTAKAEEAKAQANQNPVEVPKIWGVTIGDTASHFLKQIVEKGPKNGDGKPPQKVQDAIKEHDALLKQLRTQPDYEAEYLRKQGKTPWADHVFLIRGEATLLGLAVNGISHQAIYDPLTRDFLIFNLGVELDIPKDTTEEKTLQAVLDNLQSQFGKPIIRNERGARWEDLGENKFDMEVIIQSGRVDISFTDNNHIRDRALENIKEFLRTADQNKTAPKIEGKLD
jgi:hypothetical protein